MISAIEYHEELEAGFITVRFLPKLAEVVMQYQGPDGAIVDEDFSFLSGAHIKSTTLAIVRRIEATRAEYQRVYNGMDKFLDVIDGILEEI